MGRYHEANETAIEMGEAEEDLRDNKIKKKVREEELKESEASSILSDCDKKPYILCCSNL